MFTSHRKMKKILIRILMGIIVLSIVGAGGFFLFLESKKEAKQEAIQYNQEKVVQMIDEQLAGIEMEPIIAKENLILEKSIEELQSSIQNGDLTYLELTAYYLDRIRRIDQTEAGLNSVAEVNPNAIAEAKECDIKSGRRESLLFGMPITLKDNINAVGMPMSAGTFILKDYMPSEDAALVKNLKDQGAIVIAKVNMSELANFTAPKTPSGYSAKVGQTRNPFGPLTITPSGSSSGSAVSITSNIGVLSIGTETTGSIISPSNINSVVGMKPSKGNVDSDGVFPLSYSLDVAGPIAKNVKDVALAYNVISNSNAQKVEIDALDKNSFQGKRIGFTKTDDPKADTLKNTLTKLGATVVDVEVNIFGLRNDKIIYNEFKFDVQDFASKNKLPFSDLGELIEFNNQDVSRRAKYGQQELEKANETEKNDEDFVKSQIAEAKKRLGDVKKANNLDAIVSLNEYDVLVPAVAGYPEITVPYGKNQKGEPQGVLLIAFENQDVELLHLAYALEQETMMRQIPQFER